MATTLLVVDDSMIIRVLIKDLAASIGWQVVAEAADGAQAIERYREFRPDVVALDLVMPTYDGLHALRGIRELDPSAKVLVVSAIDQREVLQQAIELGAAGFVVKPFAKPRLMEALTRLSRPTSAVPLEVSLHRVLPTGACR
jgi:two-component system chemotaxis response regulator CheY